MEFNVPELFKILGRMEAKLDQIPVELKGHVDRMNRIDEDIEDVRKDVSSLQKRVYVITGMGIGISFMLNIFPRLWSLFKL